MLFNLCPKLPITSKANSVPRKVQKGITFHLKLHGLRRFYAGEGPPFHPPRKISDEQSSTFFRFFLYLLLFFMGSNVCS
jgi:hypothetical protein